MFGRLAAAASGAASSCSIATHTGPGMFPPFLSKNEPCNAELAVSCNCSLVQNSADNHDKGPFLHLCNFHITHLNPFVTPCCMRLDECAVTFPAQAASVVLALWQLPISQALR